MLSSINFQGNYNIVPSKASPLCKVVAAVDISKFAKEFDGEMTSNPEAYDAFDAIQQPYTLAIDEDKISKEKFNALLDELDALDVKFTKEKDSDSKLDIQG